MQRAIPARALRIFLAPGVFIHELGHTLMSVFTGHRVYEFNAWKWQGGEVIHERPKGLFSRTLIAFGPAVLGTFILLGAGWLISPNFFRVENLDLRSFFGDLPAWPVTILLIYLIINISATLAPSKLDLQAGLSAFGAIVFLTGFFGYLLFLDQKISLRALLGLDLLPFMTFVIGVELIALIFAYILALVRRWSKRI